MTDEPDDKPDRWKIPPVKERDDTETDEQPSESEYDRFEALTRQLANTPKLKHE